MSHPAALIEQIRSQVEDDYPTDIFDYTIEKSIPGTRYFPDILVRSRAGRMVCAVEIGYTRPEKLTAYRELGIEDVRWYSKAGNLHSAHETTNVVVRPAPPTSIALYYIPGVPACPYCMEQCGPETSEEEVWEIGTEAVLSLLATDYVRFWWVAYCDQCDSARPVGHECPEVSMVVSDLLTERPSDFGRVYGARTMVDWEEACARGESLGGRLDFMDGHWLDPDAVSSVLDRARSDLRAERTGTSQV